MVCAIVEEEGGDRHMRTKNGLHCNVQRKSVVSYDDENFTPTGIFVAEQSVSCYA